MHGEELKMLWRLEKYELQIVLWAHNISFIIDLWTRGQFFLISW